VRIVYSEGESMPDRDVVLAKVAAIKRCLKRIEDVTNHDPDKLDDLNVQDIFVLNLQRAIQSAIDLGIHIIASEDLGLSDTVRGNFELLENGKIIDKTLSRKMQSMVGFRNIAIHDYQALDVRILKTIFAKHLKDIEDFYATVLRHFNFAKEK
jgi:uncharacterized protein YutE (UPF0331/DUF86 family)